MRILTWNVNVLRTVLDYHPFSAMKNKSVEGLLEELGADIYCFQEHKTVRQKLDKAMACPGVWDGFWTFPRSKTGYSGVCTYVDSRLCVPIKAEEGITGLLLGDKGSTMKPPWTEVEKIGYYPDFTNELEMDPEVDGTPFDPRRLDMEGRAVVCDFGMFVLFNLYCPNETNETRRPYKMNFLHTLEARVRALMAAGREVIIAGDINVMRAPLDSGEGGIRNTAEQHYEHPARRWLDNWCAPKGPMIDVVRESHPDREGMFTCWNLKIDARPANYGTRIDYILCSPGLRPWVKGGDIQAKVYGSDHCPVYIDLHDSIELDGRTVHIRDMLNPVNRPPSTAPMYPSDIPRVGPEPPRFATKFLDEFSAKQRTLMSLWAKPSPSPTASKSASPAATPAVTEPSVEPDGIITDPPSPPPSPPRSAFGIARAAFESLDASGHSGSSTAAGTQTEVTRTRQEGPSQATPSAATVSDLDSQKTVPKRSSTVDLTQDEPEMKRPAVQPSRSASFDKKAKGKAAKPSSGQQKLSSFFSAPPKPDKSVKPSTPPAAIMPSASLPPPMIPSEEPPDINQDELLAQALAEEDERDAERERQRKAKQEEAAPVWSSLFARKLPPLCTVHQKPCKDFIVKINGPNKGKRFWLCSQPVGPGYDTGRSKRPREDVDPKYRCDFFLWDSANSRKETPKT